MCGTFLRNWTLVVISLKQTVITVRCVMNIMIITKQKTDT